MHVCLRHRKPASACVREQHNTKEGKQTARRKRHSKRSQAAAYCKLCQNPADARLRALVCSSQPAAVRNVESSTSSSEAAALCDVTATTRKPATQRMSQGATQHKRGKTDGEENNTIPNAPSGCLLQALNDADDAFSPKRMRQRATHTEKRRNKQRGRITNQNVAKPLITANFANSKSLTEDARLRAFD